MNDLTPSNNTKYKFVMRLHFHCFKQEERNSLIWPMDWILHTILDYITHRSNVTWIRRSYHNSKCMRYEQYLCILYHYRSENYLRREKDKKLQVTITTISSN